MNEKGPTISRLAEKRDFKTDGFKVQTIGKKPERHD
jgi:hypothetical protein